MRYFALHFPSLLHASFLPRVLTGTKHFRDGLELNDESFFLFAFPKISFEFIRIKSQIQSSKLSLISTEIATHRSLDLKEIEWKNKQFEQ